VDPNLQNAFIRGVERLSAWKELLDNINVFPVADKDTGRNLIISLTPLLQLNNNRDTMIQRLLMSARGNSGNIAASFFSGFLSADSLTTLSQAAMLGRDRAWKSVSKPKSGTMLTVFDSLTESLSGYPIENDFEIIISNLEKAVRSTSEILPQMKNANVVDSGALGMFIYLETFLKELILQSDNFKPVTERFHGLLSVSSDFKDKREEGYCVNVAFRIHENNDDIIRKIPEYGKDTVISSYGDCLKIHFHTDNKDKIREEFESAGTILQWSDERIENQTKFYESNTDKKHIHIITDAAGSVTREDCDKWGITLLDSYITIGDTSFPETFLTPSELYESMKKGEKVSTSQSSLFERHQHYETLYNQYKNLLYLCVGSLFTGNYQVASEWKAGNDKENHMKIIDTGAASGRLGIIALSTARYALKTDDFSSVIKFAEKAVENSEEYLFLDKLKYLAAGGRLSKTGAFIGDVLNMKPVISPMSDGAKKVGMVRNQNDQLKFALEKLKNRFEKDSTPFIMLEYSDNQSWVSNDIQEKIKAEYPFAEIIVHPLSLTSGAHMGPGTWGIAFIKSEVKRQEAGVRS